ncbi:MAG TPA: hypothetical protein DDZ84_11685 [Firmicutes bacterium]|jgi:glycosyltransferase involved in cell wall biosynthesis|nr:hypothetical protein [Bacillota bacterium]
MAVMLYISTVYPDVRGVKWVSTFRDAGMDVVVLRGRGLKGGSDLWPERGDAELVESIEKLDTKFPIMPSLARRIARRALSYQPAVILVRDIFLAGYALYAARRLDIPCYVDAADNYPEVMKTVAKSQLGRLGGFCLLNLWERHVLRSANGVIVVTPESKNHIVHKHHISPSRVFVVENVPKNSHAHVSTKSCFTGKLVYVGTVDRGVRDLATAIEGLKEYHELTGEKVSLTVYSFAPDEVQGTVCQLEEYAEYVTVMPTVANQALFHTLQRFDAGVVPHCRCPATEYTAPNKLYDYLYSGIPVLCSDNPPLKRIIGDTGGGIAYSCGDANSFALALRRLKAEIEHGCAKVDTSVLLSKYEWDAQVQCFVRRVRETLKQNEGTGQSK